MTAIQESGYPRPLKLTVDNFMALHDSGAFEGLRKVELIEGELLTMSPQHAPHVWAKSQLSFRLFEALRDLGSPLSPLVEGTVEMSGFDAPEPDIVLAPRPTESRLIPVASVALAIEVADSSLGFDLGRKAQLYATHRIPEYWVLGLPTETIEQMWNPVEGAYTERRRLDLGERIESVTVPGLIVRTDDLT